jgi:hypothetical protein
VGGRAKIESASSTPELDKQLWRFEQNSSRYAAINKSAGTGLSLGYDSGKSLRVMLHNSSPNTTWDLIPYNGLYLIKASSNVAAVSGDATELYAHQADNYTNRNYVIMFVNTQWYHADDSQFEFVRWTGDQTGIEDVKAPFDDPIVGIHYYTLAGQEISKPAVTGLYILLNTHASGKKTAVKKLVIAC